MRRPISKRKCKHCRTFFDPDPRSVRRQRYCAQPACRQASKAASHRRWQQQPHNRDYVRGPTPVERVRQGRQDPRATGDASALGPLKRYKRTERSKRRKHNGLTMMRYHMRYTIPSSCNPRFSLLLSPISPA